MIVKPRAAERVRAAVNVLFYRKGIRAVSIEEIVSRAGVAKPSLYRSYPSKRELAVQYLRDYEVAFWERFEAAEVAHPGDVRAQLLACFRSLSEQAGQPGYRGCGLSNALVEYPEHDCPVRMLVFEHKSKLRNRLTSMAQALGARNASALADGLLLLLEGAHITGQVFETNGPGGSLVFIVEGLVDMAIAP